MGDKEKGGGGEVEIDGTSTDVVVSLGIHHYELGAIEDDGGGLSEFRGFVTVSTVSDAEASVSL